MAKQWATRVIIAFQSACWCVAILLLLSRGVGNLRASFSPPPRYQPEPEVNQTTNATASLADDDSARHGFTLGVGLIAIAALMILASPAIIVARAFDHRRYRSVERFPDLGLPPRYEDIVSPVPSYSSLFDADERVEESQQLQDTTTPITVI